MHITNPESSSPTCDGHIHTYLCGHAVGEMEEYVQSAIGQGLQEMVFLEHYETAVHYFEKTWLSPAEFTYYQQEGLRLRSKYAQQIKVGIGVEVGLNPDDIGDAATCIASFPWDRVGLSYHFLAQGQNHINMVSRKAENIARLAAYGHERVLGNYLRGLLAGVQGLKVDVVCHLDAVMRFSAGVEWRAEHLGLLAEIFTVMAAKAIALEINTSGLALGREVFPAAWLRAMAQEYNLSYLYGSDAHRPGAVGQFFNQLPQDLG